MAHETRRLPEVSVFGGQGIPSGQLAELRERGQPGLDSVVDRVAVRQLVQHLTEGVDVDLAPVVAARARAVAVECCAEALWLVGSAILGIVGMVPQIIIIMGVFLRA